ncbi:MAG: transporter [Myxococcota bacterium]
MAAPLRLALVLAALLASAAAPPRARACSTCTVGDPTLTVTGTEQPFRNRVRASATLRHRRETLAADGPNGPIDDAFRLRESRLELGLSWAATDRVVLAATMPLIHQQIAYPNLARDRRWAAGDLDLRARVVLFRDRQLAPKHLLSGVVGLELPTAPALRDPAGRVLFDLQAGSGSVDPLVGLLYSRFAGITSVHLTTTLLMPSEGHARRRLGPSWQASVTGQVQPWSAFGFRASLDGRLDGREAESGQRDGESGGAILYATVGAVALPVPADADLVLMAQVSVPVVQRLRGGHDEGLVLSAGVTHDF